MISPVDLLPEDGHICQPCFLLLTSEGANHRILGHTMVCLGCGRSVRDIRHHIIESGSPILLQFSFTARLQVKRMGVGGRLVPFFKCVCVYFVALGAGGGGPSPGAVAAKCAPVLCLLLLVLLHVATLPHHKGARARRVAAGLALSALGDALLLWPQHFVAGMAAFAGAHVAYIAALGWAPRAPALGGALYAATLLFLSRVAPPPGLRAIVPLYALLLATTAWRGAARGGPAAAGALLFLLSDALLGYSLFGGPVPHHQLLVMSTYYLAQLGLALSALRPDAERG